MTQADVILDHMQNNKGITSWEAFREYGITRLAAVINQLEKKGYMIGREPKLTETRLGHKTTYFQYYLVGERG